MTQRKSFKDFKSSAPSINGFSTINHNLRVKLRLNCSEYVLLDYIDKRQKAKKVADIENCRVKTGFSDHEQKHILNALITKGFILTPIPGADNFTLTEKWTSEMSSIEDEFENRFWKNQDGVCWPGSKATAKSNYVKVRKAHTFEFMLHQRNAYFSYLKACHDTGFQRQKMMASVFLGPQERYLEDWDKQREDLLKLHKKEEPKKEPKKAMTMDQVKELYEKDTDK